MALGSNELIPIQEEFSGQVEELTGRLIDRALAIHEAQTQKKDEIHALFSELETSGRALWSCLLRAFF